MKAIPVLRWCIALACWQGSLLSARAQSFIFPPIIDFEHAAAVETSYTFASSFDEEGPSLGNVDALYTRAGYLGTFSTSKRYALLGGVEWQRFGFGAPAGVAVPSSVNSIALRLGNNWQFAEGWAFRFEVAPGIYSDFQDISGDDVGVPFSFRVTYDARTNLTWVLGLFVDARSDWPVIGGPGVRWRFAPSWTLNLIMPRPRVEYSPMRALTLFAGGELRSGTFRVAEDFGQLNGRPVLDNDLFSYREIRAGGGLRYSVTKQIAAALEGGWAANRRMRYPDSGVKLDGDGAPYLQLSVLGRF